MSQLHHPFNPADFDPSQGPGNWPLGKHPVIITKAEVTGTKDGANGMLVFTLRVTDGPEAGYENVYRLNIYHSNEDTVRIAHRQLSAVCHVLQTFQLGQNGSDLTPLFNKPFIVEIALQKAKTEEDKAKGYTEIRRVYDINGNEPGKPGASQNPPQQQQQFNNQQQPQQNSGNAGGAGLGGGNQNAGQGNGQPQGGQGSNNAGWGQSNQQQEAQAPAQQGNNGGGWGQNNGNNQQSNPPQQNAGNQGGWGQQNQGNNNGGGASWGQRN